MNICYDPPPPLEHITPRSFAVKRIVCTSESGVAAPLIPSSHTIQQLCWWKSGAICCPTNTKIAAPAELLAISLRQDFHYFICTVPNIIMLSRALLFLLISLGLVSSNAVEDVTNLRGSDEALARQKQQHVDDTTTWWEQGRELTPSTVCPYPDSVNLSPVRSGQYGSSAGDCFYLYWNPNKCNMKSKCPLYVFVDGTLQSEDVDDRDSLFMKEMAERDHVAVVADYDDSLMGYMGGCEGLGEKGKKIFDDSVVGSVLHQLCQDDNNVFGHRNVVPVDCNKGVAVNGYSQGSQVSALANNFSPFITAGLFWGNGNFCTFCAIKFRACSMCGTKDTPCMNSNQIALPKEKRRYINGEKDSYFGACEDWFGRNYRVSFPAPHQALPHVYNFALITSLSCISAE